jgi:hypothetical protein
VRTDTSADFPTIDRIEDGGTYAFPAVQLVETGLFHRVGCIGELFIKVPSARGLDDYRRFAKLAVRHEEDVRSVEEAERWERLEDTLEVFPGLKPLLRVGSEVAHYLAVHKLQYERLRAQTAVLIPRAKFGVLQSTHRYVFRHLEPALFQEKVPGMTLWDMFDFNQNRVYPNWREFLPGISVRLSALLDSSLLNHIDWNIKNFVFDATQDCLFYVDMKPTTLLSRSSNETNLKGLRLHFVV